MGQKEQNNMIDTQAQGLKNIDIKDIKKLFDKIPKDYLNTLDLDWDSDFDEQDIQKLINWEIDPNSVIWKELKAKKEAISIKLLKEIINNIANRIKEREWKKTPISTPKFQWVKKWWEIWKETGFKYELFEDVQNKINKISQKYDSKEELLKNKKDRLAILKSLSIWFKKRNSRKRKSRINKKTRLNSFKRKNRKYINW